MLLHSSVPDQWRLLNSSGENATEFGVLFMLMILLLFTREEKGSFTGYKDELLNNDQYGSLVKIEQRIKYCCSHYFLFLCFYV